MLHGRHLAFLLVMTTGCGALGCSSEPPAGDATGNVCTPGATQACLGPGRCEGAQLCAPDGASWAACECTGSPQPPDGGSGGVSDSGGAPPPDGAPSSLIDALDPDGPLAVKIEGWLEVPGRPEGAYRAVARGDYMVFDTPPAVPPICAPDRFFFSTKGRPDEPGLISLVGMDLRADSEIVAGVYADNDFPTSRASFYGIWSDNTGRAAVDVSGDVPMFTLDIRTYNVVTRRVALEMRVFGTVTSPDSEVGRADLTIAVAGICP